MKSTWYLIEEKGILLHLYIQPGSSKTQIAGLHDQRLKIKIQAPPHDGEANEALQEFLADLLKIGKKKVHLIRGENSRIKDVLIELSSTDFFKVWPMPELISEQ